MGDYTIGFTANVENLKSGNGKIAANVKDNAGNQVADVTVKLSMPKHGPDIVPLELKHTSAGWYEAPRAPVICLSDASEHGGYSQPQSGSGSAAIVQIL